MKSKGVEVPLKNNNNKQNCIPNFVRPKSIIFSDFVDTPFNIR